MSLLNTFLLDSYVLTDIIVPFFLIFTITFILASRIDFFTKSHSVIIGMIMGLMVVIPHVYNRYPPCGDVVEIIKNSLPKISLLIVAIVCFFLILGMVGLNLNFLERFMGGIALLVFGFMIYTFLTSRGNGCFNYYLNLPDIPFLDYLIPLPIFGLVIWFVTRRSSGSRDFDVY